jgi:nucleoid-associated protein EbfC
MYAEQERDIGKLAEDARAMQRRLEALRGELRPTEVIGSGGGGAVQVTITAQGEVGAVRIDPRVVDADNVRALEGMFRAAIEDAFAAIQCRTEDLAGPAGPADR